MNKHSFLRTLCVDNSLAGKAYICCGKLRNYFDEIELVHQLSAASEGFAAVTLIYLWKLKQIKSEWLWIEVWKLNLAEFVLNSKESGFSIRISVWNRSNNTKKGNAKSKQWGKCGMLLLVNSWESVSKKEKRTGACSDTERTLYCFDIKIAASTEQRKIHIFREKLLSNINTKGGPHESECYRAQPRPTGISMWHLRGDDWSFTSNAWHSIEIPALSKPQFMNVETLEIKIVLSIQTVCLLLAAWLRWHTGELFRKRWRWACVCIVGSAATRWERDRRNRHNVLISWIISSEHVFFPPRLPGSVAKFNNSIRIAFEMTTRNRLFHFMITSSCHKWNSFAPRSQ